jgi:hypothetical protein
MGVPASPRPLHPAWRAYRRSQRILVILVLAEALLVGIFASGRLSEKAFTALLQLVLLAAVLPVLFLTWFRCPSCRRLWLLNAFSRRCRSCGLGLYQDPAPPPAGPAAR